MTEELAVYIVQSGIMTILKIVVPVLSVALVIGLVVSIFQAATQIQDNILGFLPKMVAIVLIVGTGFLYGFQFLEQLVWDVFGRISGI